MVSKIPRQKMPAQDEKNRIENFDEVALGYDEEIAVKEALRCLQCKNAPCNTGCPVEIDIPGFINAIKEQDFTEADRILKNKNNLPGICGRVCPQETQCEIRCVLGKNGEPVAIGRLERFVSDWGIAHKNEIILDDPLHTMGVSSQRIAVVGSGPAGLTCAADLAKMGYGVTIFESFHEPGGVLTYGIPEFRLPKDIVKKEVDYVKSLGVEIKLNMIIGKILSIHELFKNGYDAVFIGTGAGLPNFLKIPGENLCGVYSANEFLTRVNLMRAYKFPEYDTPIMRAQKVAVIGGGNVALDSARVALRLRSSEVHIVYRRSERELPGRDEEVEHAKEEGVIFNLLAAPVKLEGNDNGYVKSMTCIRMELGEPDSSGRRMPVPIKGSEFTFEVDMVVVAIGTSPNPLLLKATPELKAGKWGNLVVDANTGATSMKGVYAAGDIVTGSATVIEAMGSAKCAARAIDEYLKNL